MKTRPILLLALSLGCLCFTHAAQAQDKKSWWPADVEEALERAGANRGQLTQALSSVPQDQRNGMAFLVANMPDSDLRSLKADFLLENVALAYKARQQAPWSAKISEEMFLNNVLPYANVDETRHPWRQEFYTQWWPVVKDCKTAAEAAQKLNETVFKQLNVKYSTARKKANQSPKETIEQGLASCTGLSIVLIDACRSVGVPARIVGTPMWTDKSGNHNWVEIWDGHWHFVGACEPDPKGLDHGWFEEKASLAIKDSPRNAIYAASFKKTDTIFPLDWARNRKDVYAENVTDTYIRRLQGKKAQRAAQGPGGQDRQGRPGVSSPPARPSRRNGRFDAHARPMARRQRERRPPRRLEGVCRRPHPRRNEKGLHGQPGAFQGTPQPLRCPQRRRTADEWLAAGHRHARRRRRPKIGQRQPMEADAEVLQGPACRRRLSVPRAASPQRYLERLLRRICAATDHQPDSPVRAVRRRRSQQGVPDGLLARRLRRLLTSARRSPTVSPPSTAAPAPRPTAPFRR